MSHQTGIISVQARMNSTRLPGKVLLPIGQKRVIERVIEQYNRNTLLDQSVLAIGDRPENEALVELAERNGYDYTVGPEDDLLARHRSVAETFEADFLVRVTGDCPFIPPEEIERLVQAHYANDADYTTNTGENVPDGIVVDVIELGVLDELVDLDENHPVRRLRNNSQEWSVTFDRSDAWQKFGDVHLAVDTPSDYWTLIDAVDAVGADPVDVAKWCQEHSIGLDGSLD